MKNNNKGLLLTVVIVLILIIDQWSKFYIKTNFTIGQHINILGFDWAQIYFIENEGMAFGLSFGNQIGKLILTMFRLVTVTFLIWYMASLIKKNAVKIGPLIALSMICAGALGNIIDSVFYGLIFSESTYYDVAKFMPESGGYGNIFFGKVVDMFYFPFVKSTYPDWVPFMGGKTFTFFAHIFNVADSSITTGISLILIFYRKVFFK